MHVGLYNVHSLHAVATCLLLCKSTLVCLDKSSNAFRKLWPGNSLKIHSAFIPHCRVPARFVLSYACCFPPIVYSGFCTVYAGKRGEKSYTELQ